MRHSSAPLKLFVLTVPLLFSTASFGHAEHDRARFVSPTGADTGRCDNPVRACKTIAYAVRQASKGDRVLVAEGSYRVETDEDLFYLTGKLVPVLGGFNRFDHFLDQAPQVNPTILTGVPAGYVEQLQHQGFVVVNDGFASRINTEQLDAVNQQLQQSQGPTACVNGKAGIYPCKNIDLVSHVALGDMSIKPGAGNDIWGHVDLNSGIEYAIIGLDNGTAVFSLADPANPVEVGAISGSVTSWRDIKVLQYYDNQAQKFKAYAYVTSEGSDNVHILDLNNLPNSVTLVKNDKAVTSAHNVYISNVDYTTNTALDGMEPLLHIVGQKAVGGAFTSYGLKNPTSLTSYFAHLGATRSDYTHDAASMRVDDSRALQSCKTAVCTVLMDFNEKTVRLWNITDTKTAAQLSETGYTNASYTHSGWWSEDKRYVFIHDELDETDHGLNTTVRVMNVDNLEAPSIVKEWSGPTRAIDHNGYTRGNRYYISNYQRGTTILDITDPTNPSEAGFFDSFPSSDGAAFNGVWGTYPFLPSGLIISADINSGLFVLRDQTKTAVAGQVAFPSLTSSVAAGQAVELSVKRPSGSGAVSVQWETLNLFGINSTSQLATGTLQWAADDVADKTIRFTPPADTSYGKVFVRLFNPTSGLTLGTPAYHTVTIGTKPLAAGAAGFAQTTQLINENGGNASVAVNREGGSSGALKVSYTLVNGTATVGDDIDAVSGELSWADGDASARSITVHPVDDTRLEGDETVTLQLTAVQGALQTGRDKLTLTIRDNEQNRAPQATLDVPAQVNAGATVTLKASATDADGDSISYSWQQLSGTAVTINNATSAQASFVAPNGAGELSFRLTVTDSRGGSTSSTALVQVIAANTAPQVTITSSVNNLVVSLTGDATDAEGDALSYSWQQTSGSSLSLSGANSKTVSFTAPAAGTYGLSLTVTDARGLSTTKATSVTLQAAATDNSSKSGGGSWSVAGLVALVLLARRRRTRH